MNRILGPRRERRIELLYCEARALRRDRDQRWVESDAKYREKRDSLYMNDYLDVNRALVYDPRVVGGVPAFLADWNYRG